MISFQRHVVCAAVVCSVFAPASMAAEYHVSKQGADEAAGTLQSPFTRSPGRPRHFTPVTPASSTRGLPRDDGPPALGRAGQAHPHSGGPRRWRGNFSGRTTPDEVDQAERRCVCGQDRAAAGAALLRWADGAGGPLAQRSLRRSHGPALRQGRRGNGYEKIVCKKLPPGDFNGGYAMIWRGGAWTNATVRIKDYRPGVSLAFDPPFQPQSDQYHQGDAFKPRAETASCSSVHGLRSTPPASGSSIWTAA